MTRLKILFIHFLLFLTSRAKPFKKSTIDNENTSQAINVTPSGLVNGKESITTYIKNDDILSISEFSKFYNPNGHHFTNVRFIKETDSDYVEKVRFKNIKTSLEIPKLKEYNEENKTDKNVDSTMVDSEEESRESKVQRLSTETNEVESTTIRIKGHGKTGELIEGYEDDLEVPEKIESTERYFKIDVSNDKRNSDRPDEIIPAIPSRRSFLPNEDRLLDTEEKISNKPIEIVDVDQVTVPKSVIVSFKRPNVQSKVESTTETPIVAPQLIHPDPAISDKQFNNLSPLLTLGTTDPADLREISNEETTNIGDEYKQSNNLDTSGKNSTKEKTVDEYNSNIYENAYPYTPSNVKSISQQPLTKRPNFNSLYSKFTQASGHPPRNRVPGGQSLSNYGTILPNFNLQNRYLQNVGSYNFVSRTRRFLSCNRCGHKYKMFMN